MGVNKIMARKVCWLCQDKVATLYNGAPGIVGTFDEVCLECAAEKVTDYIGESDENLANMTDTQKRALVKKAGLVVAA